MALSEEDNFDYISSLHTENGARISYASKNKITVFCGSADFIARVKEQLKKKIKAVDTAK